MTAGEKLAADPEFRQRLLDDPRGALSDLVAGGGLCWTNCGDGLP